MRAQSPRSWLEQLQQIDRRILYLILLFVVALPTLRPINIPNVPLPMSEDLWKIIEATPKDKIVLLSSTWTWNTRGESQSQARAILHHLMSRRIRFLTSSFDAQASQVILNEVETLAKQYHYEYGTDWAHLGFQPSAANFIKAINVDLLNRQETVRNVPLKDLPVMRGINSIDDVYLVVEISGAAVHLSWIQFLKPGIKVGFCPTSVMAPQAVPYYQTKQLVGILWGARGGYDYEQLNVKHGIGRYDKGREYMGPLAAAFGLIIAAIVVGNLAMFLSRVRSSQGGKTR